MFLISIMQGTLCEIHADNLCQYGEPWRGPWCERAYTHAPYTPTQVQDLGARERRGSREPRAETPHDIPTECMPRCTTGLCRYSKVEQRIQRLVYMSLLEKAYILVRERPMELRGSPMKVRHVRCGVVRLRVVAHVTVDE